MLEEIEWARMTRILATCQRREPAQQESYDVKQS
jgi:hypothetical protein